jgi:hypothetical protein
VLTAHHCVAQTQSQVTSCGNSYGQQFAAGQFYVTTSYDAINQFVGHFTGQWPQQDGVTWWTVSSVSVPGNDICGDDMALLQLSEPIKGVCPLIPRVDTPLTDGETYEAIGFGITSASDSPTNAGTRRSATTMAVQCSTDCPAGQIMNGTLEFQGASSTQGTCEGDSGGPAIDSKGRVFGSDSRGGGNCDFAIYESVFGQAAWIKQVATAAAQAGGYSPAGWVTGSATSNPANGYCASSGTGSSSSSSSGAGASSSSGGAASSSSGSTSSGGTGGTGPTGGGAGGGGTTSTGTGYGSTPACGHSGCAYAPLGDDGPSSFATLSGLLAGLALLVSRRRR